MEELGYFVYVLDILSVLFIMFALGCIQALQCNQNTCPTGITTHDPKLQRGLNPESKSVRVVNYVRNMLHEVGVIAHARGVREPRELQRFHARIVTESGHSLPLDEACRQGRIGPIITSGNPK